MDTNRFTNEAFYGLHPEMRGHAIDKSQKALAKEWLDLRGKLEDTMIFGQFDRGNKDSNAITNDLFWGRHPELRGKKIEPSQKAFAAEWKEIKKTVDKRLDALTKLPGSDGFKSLSPPEKLHVMDTLRKLGGDPRAVENFSTLLAMPFEPSSLHRPVLDLVAAHALEPGAAGKIFDFAMSTPGPRGNAGLAEVLKSLEKRSPIEQEHLDTLKGLLSEPQFDKLAGWDQDVVVQALVDSSADLRVIDAFQGFFQFYADSVPSGLLKPALELIKAQGPSGLETGVDSMLACVHNLDSEGNGKQLLEALSRCSPLPEDKAGAASSLMHSAGMRSLDAGQEKLLIEVLERSKFDPALAYAIQAKIEDPKFHALDSRSKAAALQSGLEA